MTIKTISLIGAGNIAWHLGKVLFSKGYNICQVYARKKEQSFALADELNAEAINSLELLNPQVDLILVCISDKAISEIANKLPIQPKLIAHTAGSVALSALAKFNNHGVFYPLQTFSKDVAVDFSNVPLCIESNNNTNKQLLINLAKTISNKVYELDSTQRLRCHLAAVFANNFSNHMFHLAEQFLAKNDIPFDILKPIISETARKVQDTSPSLAQTGPAARNDTSTMESHLKLLSSPELEKIYSFVSQNIRTTNQQKTK